MDNGNKLCLNCMREMPLNAEQCPHCGNKKEIHNREIFLQAGSVIKGYMVGKLIAYCGDCAVYIGRNELTEERVIIREFLPTTMLEPVRTGTAVTVSAENATLYKALMMDFIDLYNSLYALNGEECLVNIMEMFQLGGTAYVVQEYFEGIALSDLLEERGSEPLSWEQTEMLMMPLLKSLDRVHKRQIVHRAICPKKITISREGQIKLLDFSVSSARTEKTEISAEIFGGYSAPEQYRINGKQGTWTDVYGICATLYRMLTGVVPQDAATRLVSDKLVDACILNDTVPASVSDSLKAGLAIAPAGRIATIEELINGLNGLGIRSRSPQAESAQQEEKKKKNGKKPFFTAERIRNLKIMGISAGITVVALSLIILMISGLMSRGDEMPSSSDTTSQTSAGQEELVAPNFVGKTIASIQTNEAYSNFTFNVTEEYNDNVVQGVVISQTPKEKEEITSTQTFDLVVSKGPKTVKMPTVVGLDINAAKATLDNYGIIYEVRMAYSATDAPGTVLDCDFAADSDVILSSDRPILKVANDQSGQ